MTRIVGMERLREYTGLPPHIDNDIGQLLAGLLSLHLPYFSGMVGVDRNVDQNHTAYEKSEWEVSLCMMRSNGNVHFTTESEIPQFGRGYSSVMVGMRVAFRYIEFRRQLETVLALDGDADGYEALLRATGHWGEVVHLVSVNQVAWTRT